jgi:hypothetical protein
MPLWECRILTINKVVWVKKTRQADDSKNSRQVGENKKAAVNLLEKAPASCQGLGLQRRRFYFINISFFDSTKFPACKR